MTTRPAKPIPSIQVRVTGSNAQLKAEAERVVYDALLAAGFTDRDPNRPRLRLVPDPNPERNPA